MSDRFSGDWTTKKFGDIGKFIGGSAFPLIYQGKSSARYPFYKVSDFNNSENQRVMTKANNYISEEVAKTLRCKIIPPNSIIFAKIGAAIYLERKRLNISECCIDNNMMAFQPFADIDSRFICYWLCNIHLGDYAQTTALPSLSTKAIRNISINLPPLDEQRAIAETLSAFDNHIDALSALIDKKKAIREGALNGLMSREIRVDNFSGDWIVNKLGDIGHVQMCHRVFQYQTSTMGDIPFYKIGTFGGKADAYIPRRLFEIYKKKYPYPEKGDVLISVAGTIGKTVVFDGNDAYFQDSNIVWLKVNKNLIDPRYLWFFYRSYPWRILEGSTIKRLYNNILLNTEIPLPPIEEQRAIAEVLTAMDDNIAALTAEREKVMQMREGAIEDLMTGKVRLKMEW